MNRRRAALEKRLEKLFPRAVRRSVWWRQQLRRAKFCTRCRGRLATRYVPAEHRRRRVCARCGFIAYENPKIIAATLPVRAGRVVLLRRGIEPALGLWTFPAGHMEIGETAEQAAARETREEIGSRVRLGGLFGVYSYADGGVVTLVYRARVLSRPRAGDEALSVRAFRPAEIPWQELAFRNTYHALKDWVADRSAARRRGK